MAMKATGASLENEVIAERITRHLQIARKKRGRSIFEGVPSVKDVLLNNHEIDFLLKLIEFADNVRTHMERH